MKIRFGYVANALGLWDASPSKTLTFKRYAALPKEERLEKLHTVTYQNLYHTKRILHYNIAHEIPLYRFSGMRVPLATHPEVLWDFHHPVPMRMAGNWRNGKETSNKGKLSSRAVHLFYIPRERGDDQCGKGYKEYHYRMLEAMGITDSAILNIHIGGAYGEKKESIVRFHKNLQKLPEKIKKVMTWKMTTKRIT